MPPTIISKERGEYHPDSVLVMLKTNNDQRLGVEYQTGGWQIEFQGMYPALGVMELINKSGFKLSEHYTPRDRDQIQAALDFLLAQSNPYQPDFLVRFRDTELIGFRQTPSASELRFADGAALRNTVLAITDAVLLQAAPARS